MNESEMINWLLAGDVSIQYQVHRDLLQSERKALQERIAHEGWGARFLRKRHKDGHWGRGFYLPKWTSTHYTLLDLKNLGIQQNHEAIQQSISLILDTEKTEDGGVCPMGPEKNSDVCVVGMFLNYASYFQTDEADLKSVIDFLLTENMSDGGFNCYSNRVRGASHSSVHSTLSVLEGISEYERSGYKYRLKDLKQAKRKAIEFLLIHRLFRSHRSGEIMDKKMLMLSYPSRWKYDILRALDYFQSEGIAYDSRMDDAFEVLFKKRRKDGTWPLQAKHSGLIHFDMEKPGQASRWNTLRALRVLEHFEIDLV